MHRLLARFRLCWCLVVLDGSDLSLEFVVELLQSLLLTDGILAVKSLLLPIAMKLCLLFFHLIFQSTSI